MSLEPTTLSLLIGGLLVLALLVYGLRDVLRFSLLRTWAIRGVVFRESVRRRVLWVTPLAMLAVLLLIQLQDPVDEADAIRQAARSCLFASGLVAIVVSLILASTNLPREIGNRVIFTIASKPVTRFELLLGKVLGFAQLSALVLLIMGAFTLALLWTLNLALVNRIDKALQSTLPVESRRPYLQWLSERGLLQAQHVQEPEDFQVYAEPPSDPSDTSLEPRYFLPGPYYAAVPFVLDRSIIEAVMQDASATMVIRVRAPWKPARSDTLLPDDLPLGIVNLETLPPAPPPLISVQVFDAQLSNLVPISQIENNQVQLPNSTEAPWSEAATVRLSPDQTYRVVDAAAALAPTETGPYGPVYVIVYGLNMEYLFGITPDSVQIGFQDASGSEFATVAPAVGQKPRQDVLLRTYLGSPGTGLSGPEDSLPAPVGVLAYRNVPEARAGADGLVDFELRMNPERVAGILDESDDTRIEAIVHNLHSGFTSEPAVLFPETGFPVVLRVPAAAVENGDFDLHLRTESRGHIVSVRGADVKLVVSRQPFAWNLLKALAVIWLLSVLVIAAGLAFSTFVSWPIAVMLAVFGLLGRWIVQQLGEPNESWGRQIAEGVFSGGDASVKETVRVGVDALSGLLATATAFLPDMNVYGVVSQLEHGLAVDWSHIGNAAVVTLGFALPLLALAYIVLRNKEVAP